MNKALVIGAVVWGIGCGGAAQEPVRAPSTPPTPSSTAPSPATPHKEATASAWSLPDGPRDSVEPTVPAKDIATTSWAKASKTKGVGPSPAMCATFAKPTPAKPAPTDLSAVLVEKDAAKRNAMLFAIESSKPELAPTIRLMRADLAPTECADAILDPSLTDAKGMGGQMAIGLSLSGKLARTATSAPAIKDASDKEKVKRFIQGPLRDWMVEQASAIEALSVPANDLTGLARGVVAVEAGMADLRLVDRIRSAPTPSGWDKELKAIYEAALDEALEPRKARGRDAALVGLADFAAAGIVHDARIDRARSLLSKLYGGRRIDALDDLMLPPDTSRAPGPTESVLALVPSDPAKREPFNQLNMPAASAGKTARARFEMGRAYWRKVDFVEAAHAAAKETTPEGRLLLAVSLAVAKGPKSAKEMMTAASPSALGLGGTEALDALVAESGPLAGMAAFDAAHLRSLASPDGAAAGPWFADVAARFEKAAGLLDDPTLKKRAKERAAAASATSKAIGDGKPAS